MVMCFALFDRLKQADDEVHSPYEVRYENDQADCYMSVQGIAWVQETDDRRKGAPKTMMSDRQSLSQSATGLQ